MIATSVYICAWLHLRRGATEELQTAVASFKEVAMSNVDEKEM